YLNYDPGRPCKRNDGPRDFCGPSAFQGTVTKLYHNLGRTPAEGAAVPGLKVPLARFADVTVESGLGSRPGPGLGVVCADFNGALAVFMTHLAVETNTLWKQLKPGVFQDQTRAAGLAAQPLRGTGFGTVLADFNHDGLADLAIVNGGVVRPQQGSLAGEADAAL